MIIALLYISYMSICLTSSPNKNNNFSKEITKFIGDTIVNVGQLRSTSDSSSIRGIPKREKKRLAYVITITKDGYFGLDGAAVLAFSIINTTELIRAKYDISFIAFVHPSVVLSRPGLKKLGSCAN